MKHAVTDRSARRGFRSWILVTSVALGGAACTGESTDTTIPEKTKAIVVATSSDVCGGVEEGGQITLNCPAGSTITAVPFASYGTPDGTCGSVVAGDCDAQGARALVASTCLGKTS